jgi:hypothetical protein
MTTKPLHPIKILYWQHEPFKKFMGNNRSEIFYELRLSKTDIITNTFQFGVRINMIFTNALNGIVFNARTESTFSVNYQTINNKTGEPDVKFLFGLVDAATSDFSKLFHKKTKQTNLASYDVAKPKFDILRESIKDTIDRWAVSAKKFKESGGERLSKFKNLPTIPKYKSYTEGSAGTIEQIITVKLQAHKEVSEEERRIFEDLGTFYDELSKQLLFLDYKSFTEKDIQDFRNYILYAFNSYILVSNELIVVKDLYRLVINESVTQKNESITDLRYLTYPSLEIIKKLGKYNRASTCNSTLLYLTESVDTALKEIHPPLNKLVTVSIWTPKNRKTFISYPITHNEMAVKVNEQVAQGYNAAQQLSKIHDPLLARYMNNYFNLLAREYSKPVSNQYEYMLSAILSEGIFNFNDLDTKFNYECIVYPSVGNNYITKNLAIKPNIADNEFELTKVIEFEITEADYSRSHIPNDDWENISIVKVKNKRETSNILPDGSIIW